MAPEGPSTQEKILRAAAERFAQRGYGGTSIADIAERVGIRKASLYNYYRSKGDLLVDLLERSLEAWERACRPALEGEGSCERRLAAHLAAAVGFTERNPQMVRVVRLAATQVGGELGRRVRKLIDRREQEWQEQMLRLFEEAIATGELEGIDPAAAQLFWGTFLDGILINQLFGTPRARELRAGLQRLWVCFWRGVSGRAPETGVER